MRITTQQYPQVMENPKMELINMHFWPLSREHSGSLSCSIHIESLGKVECKDLKLSPATEAAIKADLCAAMTEKMRQS